jgi:hypothetical protein
MTGIELLNRIADRIDELSQKVDILDRNVKQLMNQKSKPVAVAAVESQAPEIKEPEDIFSFKEVKRKRSSKVFGYIKRKGGIPVDKVLVTIWNGRNEQVLQRMTNSNGYWEGRLEVGRYSVEYKKDGLRPINKIVEVAGDRESLEVL